MMKHVCNLCIILLPASISHSVAHTHTHTHISWHIIITSSSRSSTRNTRRCRSYLPQLARALFPSLSLSGKCFRLCAHDCIQCVGVTPFEEAWQGRERKRQREKLRLPACFGLPLEWLHFVNININLCTSLTHTRTCSLSHTHTEPAMAASQGALNINRSRRQLSCVIPLACSCQKPSLSF